VVAAVVLDARTAAKSPWAKVSENIKHRFLDSRGWGSRRTRAPKSLTSIENHNFPAESGTHRRAPTRRNPPWVSALGMAALLFGCAPRPASAPLQEPALSPPKNELAPLRTFLLEGRPFCFQGANNYYLHYKPAATVLGVLDAARAMSLKVLRSWAFLDRGSLDASVRNARDPGHEGGVYFQYWDPALGRPAYNEGPTGLERLDFLVHSARQRGLKLILVLTNSWRDFGGMDQYLIWFGLSEHHKFYQDAQVRAAYKDWVAHLLLRQNSIDGTRYIDDPAIFGWELANEPRTVTLGEFDSPDGWDTSTIADWVEEMSSYIHSLDPNHLVSVGDEGFLPGGGEGWTYEAPFGVNHELLTSIPGVDFGTFHLYPDHWGAKLDFGEKWIEAHLKLAAKLDKPVLLEEYGLPVARSGGNQGAVISGLPARKAAYSSWNESLLRAPGSAGLFWLLAGRDGDQLYPDFDHYTVYPEDESARLLESFAARAPSSCRERESQTTHSSPFVRVADPR
jgi:mannan endo-1,4-beta-mannosidase